MVIGPDTSRAARVEDHDEIDALVQAAFGRQAEAELVRALRADGSMVLEMVKGWTDPETGIARIGAYLGISRMVAPVNWFCLAPVAVWPAWQNGALARDEDQRRFFRFGSRLAGEIAKAFTGGMMTPVLARSGLVLGEEPATLVVLGKPGFYARAGFSSARAARLRAPYPVEYLLIARPGEDVPELDLIYPQAFNGL
jgi:putative acetyltransferase